MKKLLVVLCLLVTGCEIGQAVSSAYTVPRERATECRTHCARFGMRLSAMVLIMNHAGCVCETGDRASASRSSAAAAGGAAIQLVVQQQRQQQQQQQAARR